MSRTYTDAIAALNTLQSNFQTVDMVRKSGKCLNKDSLPETVEYTRRIGYEPSDFDRLKPIHIAGTKGKGSTSAFISSILGQYLSNPAQPQLPLRKIGLYTSPHLRFVRERIQINNAPLSEELFAKYFFETWDRLESASPTQQAFANLPTKPAYFRFLTLMAFHTYMCEGIDTAIIECGIGGEYDSTNMLVQPTVTGITSLGIDHTHLLGDSIESISWHKAGIMKKDVPCFSAPQPESATNVLWQRAVEKGTTLQITLPDPKLDSIKLGLSAPFQRTNASLAIAIAKAHLHALGHTSPESLPQPFIRGLETVQLSGRCEVRHDKHVSLTWHIDSAHTVESLTLSAQWFASQLPVLTSTPLKGKRILLFNQQTRSPAPLLRAIYTTLTTSLPPGSLPFDHVVFTSNRTFADSGFKADLRSLNNDDGKVESLEVQEGMRVIWTELDQFRRTDLQSSQRVALPSSQHSGPSNIEDAEKAAGAEVVIKGSIEDAVAWCRDIASTTERGDGENVMVLVTGSVHLVGGVLEVLETEMERNREV